MATVPEISRARPRRVVGAVSAGHLLSHFYILAYPPLFPLLRSEFGLTNTELGLIMSVNMVGPLLLQWPAGGLVDRTGGKWVLVGGLATTAGGTMLVGAANSYLPILAFSLLAGVGQAVFHPADYALLDAVATDETRGRQFSLHTFGGYVGFAAAPLVVGYLGVALGWRAALLAAGGVGLGYALFLAVSMEAVYLTSEGVDADAGDDPAGSSTAGVDGEPTGRATTDAGGDGPAPEPDRESGGDPTPNGGAGGHAERDGTGHDGSDGGEADGSGAASVASSAPLVGMFAFVLLMTMATKGVQTFTPLLFVDAYALTETVGNSALTGFFAAAAAGVLAGGQIADRLSPAQIILPALSGAAALLTAVVAGMFPPVGAVLVVAFGAMGFLSGATLPARDRTVSLLSGDGAAGRSFGFVFTGIAVGGIVSPALLGRITDTVGIVPAFSLIGGFYVLAALALLAAVSAGR